jgi:cephalosporin-C deacetylase-like acetyl esterase
MSTIDATTNAMTFSLRNDMWQNCIHHKKCDSFTTNVYPSCHNLANMQSVIVLNAVRLIDTATAPPAVAEKFA